MTVNFGVSYNPPARPPLDMRDIMQENAGLDAVQEHLLNMTEALKIENQESQTQGVEFDLSQFQSTEFSPRDLEKIGHEVAEKIAENAHMKNPQKIALLDGQVVGGALNAGGFPESITGAIC